MRRLIAFLVLCLFLLSGCGEAEPVSETRYLLSTYITVTLYAPNNSDLFEPAFARAAELEKLLSRTLPESDVWRINNAEGQPVEVSEATVAVLQAALHYAALSGGLFDITVAGCLSLWDFESNTLPDKDRLSEAATLTDYTKIQLDGHFVTLPEGMQIDLGGLAKGYIADQMAQLLRENDVTSALLNLGGDILVIGAKPNGSPFRVGIQEPFAARGVTAQTVSVTEALATSGTYERGFSLDGTWYHHILDPNTGYPIQNGVLSASVTAPDAMQADALATIAVLLGGEEAAQTVRQGGGELIYMKED